MIQYFLVLKGELLIILIGSRPCLVTVHPPLAPHWRDNPVSVLNADRVRVGKRLPSLVCFSGNSIVTKNDVFRAS